MSHQNELLITFTGTAGKDQIIDSYELIKTILVDLVGQNISKFKIDNTLPLIKGDPESLKRTFREFLKKCIKHFKGLKRALLIKHVKNEQSWIFAIIQEGETEIFSKSPETNLVETIEEFTLAISKKVLKKDSIPLYLNCFNNEN